MQTLQLTAVKREAYGKKSTKALRREGMVPAVIYGGAEEVTFAISEKALKALIYTPNAYIVEIDIEGKKEVGVMREVQFHPVKDTILHMDFLEVYEDKAITMEVPVKLEGHAEGVKAGGKLQLSMKKLRVKALYNNIPERLVINIDNLGLGKTLQVGELSFEGLELMNAKNAVVCAVNLTRAARGAAAAAANKK